MHSTKKIWALAVAAALAAGVQAAGPKYVFMFIGDGMGMPQRMVAEDYSRRSGRGPLAMNALPYQCLTRTASANALITDSAAAATAMACGEKSNNGALGVMPDGRRIESVAEVAKRKGMKVGIVTTVTIVHATPAAFYAHQTNRWGYYPISKQLPASGYEFFAGPGFAEWRGRDGEQQPTGEFLAENGYTIAWGEDEFRAQMDKEHLIFCQASNRDRSASEYTTDYDSTWTSLGDMLRLGIEYLGDEEPFVFMCEGGEIDWCAHENSVYPMVQSILRLDDAVKVAYAFYEQHPDETLIVVTADHETGGLAIGYNFDWQFSVQDWGKMEARWIADGYTDKMTPQERMAFQNECGFGWTTNEHTGAPVPVYAVGKGAERFHGRIDNTDIPALIVGK